MAYRRRHEQVTYQGNGKVVCLVNVPAPGLSGKILQPIHEGSWEIIRGGRFAHHFLRSFLFLSNS